MRGEESTGNDVLGEEAGTGVPGWVNWGPVSHGCWSWDSKYWVTKVGCSASIMARTTATRGAPASITSRTLLGLTPPIANQGIGQWAAAWRTYSKPAAAFPGFVGV